MVPGLGLFLSELHGRNRHDKTAGAELDNAIIIKHEIARRSDDENRLAPGLSLILRIAHPLAAVRYTVDFPKMRDAVRDLATELLTIEATGNFDRANVLLSKYGVETPEMQGVIAGLKDIPVDIWPVFPAAGER